MPVVAPSNGVVHWEEGFKYVGVTNSCVTALINRGVLITSAAVIDMIIDVVNRADILLRFIKFDSTSVVLTKFIEIKRGPRAVTPIRPRGTRCSCPSELRG